MSKNHTKDHTKSSTKSPATGPENSPATPHPRGRSSDSGPPKRSRTPAEWTTLAVSLAVVLATAGLLVYQGATSSGLPPAFEVTPLIANTHHEDGLYYLPVDVRNTGDRAAEDVRVCVGFAGQDGAAAPDGPMAQLEIRFLTGGEVFHGVVVLDQDPAQSGLTAQVTSFHLP